MFSPSDYAKLMSWDQRRAQDIEDERKRVLQRLDEMSEDQWSEMLGALQAACEASATPFTEVMKDTIRLGLFTDPDPENE